MTFSDINMDFSQPVAIETERQEWIPSPLAGVHRRMLEREKPESGRATSIVRYEPGSYFSPHTHTGGEEFLVLDGVFSDEHGDFGAGMYIRNPVGSSHKPHSEAGCTIFVKLWQMAPEDQEFVRTDTLGGPWQAGLVAGHQVLALHRFGNERVGIVTLAPETEIAAPIGGLGQEIFVVEGAFQDEHGSYPRGSWVRLPVGTTHAPLCPTGCRLFVKVGHFDDSPDSDKPSLLSVHA
jgi:anti-sigma factor ChrR (cupin superfamily)